MGTEIAAWAPDGGSLDTTVSARVLERIAASVAPRTRAAWRSDLGVFERWCATAGRTAVPCTQETLAEYASHLADLGRAPATARRAISSIRVVHRLGGYPAPDAAAAQAAVKGYRQERAKAGQPSSSPAAALSVDQLRDITATLDPESITSLRDRLVMILGWAMMARRGTLSQLNIGDIAEVPGGLDVAVLRSKTDQAAEGLMVAVPYGEDPATCPVRLTRAWLALLASRGITSGPLFRRVDRHGRMGGEPGVTLAGRGSPDGRMSGEMVNVIVQRGAAAARLKEGHHKIKAHSLRAGGATGAYLTGADLMTIGRHGGWRDGSPVLASYIRDIDRWRNNPMKEAGL